VAANRARAFAGWLWLYLGLMSREFFMRRWLKLHPSRICGRTCSSSR
jgi:hypothetical protein